jgi:flagellar motor switch protein FliG
METDNERESLPQQSPTIDGASAAAILLMLLEESEAAAILKHLEPDDVHRLGKAMFSAAQANEQEVELALDRFVLGSRNVSALAVGAEPRIRKVMHEALGNVRADNVLAAVAPRSSVGALDILRWMEVPVIQSVLQAEHPQVGAIILSVLTPEIAGAALEGLDESIQTDLLLRAARLEAVPGDAIADLEAILRSASDRKASAPEMKLGGKYDVAKIVNNMKKASSERVLRAVKKQDKVLGQAIEEEMFVFDNLIALDAKNLGALMRSVDASILGLALKGAGDGLVAKMLASMSARAAESIRDEMAESGLVKRAEVEEAQKAIIAMARKLAAEGTIMLGDAGDDYV